MNKIITLERRFFAVNHAGDNEFDYLLELLGIKNRPDVDEISFSVDTDTIDIGDPA